MIFQSEMGQFSEIQAIIYHYTLESDNPDRLLKH